MSAGTIGKPKPEPPPRVRRFPYRALPGRFTMLLVLLVTYLLCYPFLLEGDYWRLTGVLTGLGVLAALYALSDHRTWWLFGLVLAVPALFHNLSLSPDLKSRLDVVVLVASVAFDFFLTAFILQVIFKHETIQRETIFGALCAYLAVGFAFANVFRLLVHYQPAAIYLEPTVSAHRVAERADLIYYSFASLTCMGANGMMPANAHARALTSFESIVGAMYLAVLIARLIGLHTAQRNV